MLGSHSSQAPRTVDLTFLDHWGSQGPCVKCQNVKEGMGELIPEEVPSMLHEYCANSGPGRFRVPEMTQMDRLGFSLCAAPLDIIGSCISEYMELEPQKRGIRQWGNGGPVKIHSECYNCNTKSTPVSPVTPVMSLDLISYSGSSS